MKSTNTIVQHRIPRELLHDLRTPLGPILGYSELLIEQMRDAGHEEFIPFLEKICLAGHQLNTLLKENFECDTHSICPTDEPGRAATNGLRLPDGQKNT